MKVLILSCDTGQGHNSAARAVFEAFDRRGNVCEMFDPLTLGRKRTAHIVSATYSGMLRKAPAVFGVLYRAGDIYSSTGITSPIYRANTHYADSLREYITSNSFDAVVSTHLFSMEALTAIRRKPYFAVPCFGVLTDYTRIPFFAETDLDGYFIPHDDLMDEIKVRSAKNERVLVTTLTKKMAEDLTEYLKNAGIRVRYMHSDVATIERMEIIRGLRLGEFDVLVGINLLREGLDLPEVSLVAILDADKEGFLRSETSLIQTIGRAARNAEGLVIMYADEITPSMRAAIDETERRRTIQDAYNHAHGIVPKPIIKGVREVLEISQTPEEETGRGRKKRKLTEQERAAEIAKLEKEMKEASKMLEFEYAAVLRDRIIELRGE